MTQGKAKRDVRGSLLAGNDYITYQKLETARELKRPARVNERSLIWSTC
jgi:hypothetical protein